MNIRPLTNEFAFVLKYNDYDIRWELVETSDGDILNYYQANKREAMAESVALAKRSYQLLLVEDKKGNVISRHDFRRLQANEGASELYG